MSVVKRPARSCAPAAARRWRSTTACSATPRPSSRAATSWAPPALSLGKFQKLDAVPGLPFEVVRRPTGGRAVLHGEDFEWSFAVVFPGGALGAERRAPASTPPRRTISSRARSRAAFGELGVHLDGGREAPYQRSALCFATALRHDLFARGEKVAAIAQARRGGRVLVHGSVLERRPPDELDPGGRDAARRAVAGRGPGRRRVRGRRRDALAPRAVAAGCGHPPAAARRAASGAVRADRR